MEDLQLLVKSFVARAGTASATTYAMTGVRLVLLLAILAIMCAEGMRIAPTDLGIVFRRPSRLVRGVVAVIVVVPILAVLTSTIVRPSRPVVLALAFLAAAPLAPFVLTKLARCGGSFRLAASLHVTLAALSIVTAPLVLAALGRVLEFPAVAPPLTIAGRIALTLFVPLAIGIGVRAALPRVADRPQKLLELAGIVVLLMVVAVMIVRGRSHFAEFGARDYAAMALFCALALATGHVAAPNDDEREIYALECAARNPGIALLMATSSLGPVRGAVVLPYLLVFALVSTLYSMMKRRIGTHRASERSSIA